MGLGAQGLWRRQLLLAAEEQRPAVCPPPTGHGPQALAPQSEQLPACPSGVLCRCAPAEGWWNTRLCPGQVPLCSFGASRALGAEASCAIQRLSVPMPSLAWLGVLGQGFPKAGGRGALHPVGVGMVSSSSSGARDTDFRDTLEQGSGSVGTPVS